jgi:hypothetical protein
MNVINFLFKNRTHKIVTFTFLSFLIFLLSYNNGIFWDNVLFVSKKGNYLYNSNLFNWILPNNIDPGHPPTLGFLSALSWKLLGHKLWVTHLVLVPFTIGLFYQIFLLINFYVKSNYLTLLGFILIFSDPTLITQLVIVSPEVIQLFFFFLAINSILKNNYYLKIIGLFFLSIISYRGMMLCSGVFFFEIFNNLLIEKKKLKSFLNFKLILSYLIGSIPSLSYLVWRILVVGWFFTNPNSPWYEYSKIVTLKGFIRNIIILMQRYSDFGRIFIYIFILFALFKLKNKIITKNNKQLILLSISSVFIIIAASLSMTNPFGHRYFIASYIFLTLLAFLILNQYFRKNFKIIYFTLLLGLITGNLWIYPKEIAQGWDASLAHVPYYNLRLNAIKYLDEHKIPIKNVATFFPNETAIDDIDFSGDLRSFSTFNGKNKYVFFSNVFNLKDETYKILDNNYTVIKQFKNKGIYITIYKLKNYDNS